jgi:uncharacterized repeat protein (TIGR01451 family)
MHKKNIILTSLLILVGIMAIGYATFATQLNITGTSSVSSNWDVEITNIQFKSIIGTATNAATPIFTATTATFKTNLISPGDSITYEITIKNKGTIDAKVSNIELTDSSNPAISFTTSGVQVNDLLEAGNTQTFTAVVAYNNSVTSQPANLTASLTVKLDYIQNK